MAHVARLTWQAADPAALTAELEQVLGVSFAALGAERFALPLGSAVLEVVPWRAETERDLPNRAGRLVFEPVWDSAELPAVGATSSDDPILLGIAWATVELDRAERDLGMWLVPPAATQDAAAGSAEVTSAGDDATASDGPDPLLGAVVRARRTEALPGGTLLLAEPSTEGRLAASLARDGEGPSALYLAPAAGLDAWRMAARARAVTLSRREEGPLGPQRLVARGTVAGPHLLVVDAPRV